MTTPIPADVRETKTTDMKWIKASERTPATSVPAKYIDGDYKLIGSFYPTEDGYEFYGKAVLSFSQKSLNLKNVYWLDESAISEKESQLEAARKENERLRDLLKENVISEECTLQTNRGVTKKSAYELGKEAWEEYKLIYNL